MGGYSFGASIYGLKGNNTDTPGSTNLGVLPAVATASAPTYTEGNQVALSVDLNGNLRSTGGGGGGGGTEYTEDAAAAANPAGPVNILIRKDTPAAETTTDGDNVAQRGTNYGAAYVTLLDTSGNPVSVGGGTQYDEDTAHVSGDKLTMAGVVQQTSDAALAGDGDRTALQVDSTGYLKVNIKASTTIGLAAGTNNIGDVDVLTVPAPLNVTGGGTEAAALRVTIANDSTGVVSIDDNGGSLTVDGTITANLAAGTNNIGDVDVLTVPAPLNVTGGGTEASALRVTLANDSTGVLSIDDNGASITIDGTVTANPTDYIREIDTDGSNLYVGYAVPGTATSSASWKIKRIVSSGTPTDYSARFADGNTNFDNIWDNRASLSYS